MRIESVAISDIGRVRKSNQDSVGAFPELGLFVVADGMGGHSDGEVASRMAVEIISEYFRNLPSATRRLMDNLRRLSMNLAAGSRGSRGSREDQTMLAMLRSAIELANRRIVEAGRHNPANPERGSMGSTVVALSVDVDQKRVSWAYLGDSRLYRLRNDELSLLTADHTSYGAPYWNEQLVPIDLPHTNVLLQALGIEGQVRVDGDTDTLCPGDTFLLCTDGISGPLSPEAIADELANMENMEESGRRFVTMANAAGGRDNSSVVIVRVTEA